MGGVSGKVRNKGLTVAFAFGRHLEQAGSTAV